MQAKLNARYCLDLTRRPFNEKSVWVAKGTTVSLIHTGSAYTAKILEGNHKGWEFRISESERISKLTEVSDGISPMDSNRDL